MKNMKLLLVMALLVSVTLGCTGQMDAVIRRDAVRIEIIYTDSRLATAELITVLPNGERFQGKSQRFDRTQAMMDAGAADSAEQSAKFEALQTFPGNAQATLTGNRGSTIKCRFDVTDIIIGFSSGGFGICQVSDGRVLDVFF